LPKGPAQGNGTGFHLEATVTYPEFLTYLFDREQTKELAVELAFVIDEQLLMEKHGSMQPA
jgi:hypothetical protein